MQKMVFLAAVAFWCGPALTHELGEQDRPTIRSGTRLVEVNVLVTDKDRRPVDGLTAGDFGIFDNGTEQRIELFTVERARPAASAAPSPVEPPREFSNRVAGLDGGGVTAILVDRLNTRAEDQFTARGQVAKFLEQIKPQDRIGLYVLDSNAIRVLHDFTTDASSLVRAIARFRGMTSPEFAAGETGAEGPITGDAAFDAEMAAFLGSAEARMAEHFTGIRSDSTITALESVARHLMVVRGRKNLIWISSGFPLEALMYRGRSMTAEINRATRALNDANVAIYTVDARGLVGAFASPPGAKKPVFTTLSSVTRDQEILQSVAEQTGGRAFLNTNDINGAVRRAVDDARLTYTLAYYPTHTSWDGKYREIRVKVNRPDVQVRHRKGYFAYGTPGRGARSSASIAGAIVSPLDAGGLGLTARLDPVPEKPSEAMVAIRVDPGSISLENVGERWSGAVDVIVAQVRADGSHARSFDKTIQIGVTAERLDQLKREGFAINVAIRVLPDVHRLQVVVRDVATGNLGSIVIPGKNLKSVVSAQ
jgi:VWFA-related protein